MTGALDAATADLEAALAIARDGGDAAAAAELLGILGELGGRGRALPPSRAVVTA